VSLTLWRTNLDFDLSLVRFVIDLDMIRSGSVGGAAAE
jgi:hypothetical protein